MTPRPRQTEACIARALAACPLCHDQGYVLWIFPARKPVPAFWFTRGPHGERPIPCEKCHE